MNQEELVPVVAEELLHLDQDRMLTPRSTLAECMDPDSYTADAEELLKNIAPAIEQRIKEARAEALRDFGRILIEGKDPETDRRIFDPWDVAELLYERAGTESR